MSKTSSLYLHQSIGFKHNRIPKGLMLSFELQLDKDNDNLQDSCKQHVHHASFNILKDISAAALSKTKSLQRELYFQREHLFSEKEETAAKTIWRRVKEQMATLEIDLKKKARHKFSLALPLHSLSLDQTTQSGNARRRTRRFERAVQRNIRAPTGNVGNDHEATTEVNLPDLNLINLTSSELTDAERSLLKKGPAFCPVPKDVNWQKVTDDLDKFERRIRLAVFYHGRNTEDNPQKVDERFPAIPSTSQWMPPKSSFPEVEVFLNNVKSDILKPSNLRTAKEGLLWDLNSPRDCAS